MFDFIQNAVIFLSKGGIVMIFILLCSIASAVLIIQRWLTLHTECKKNKSLEKPLLEAIAQNQTERALSLADANPCALSAIGKAAIDRRNLVRDALQEIVGDEAARQEARLNRFIPSIGAIATISPMLGLLGTVTGMIQIFSRLADEFAAGAMANPGMLAGGLWEALLTTAAGLCVAIPTFLFHRILCAKIDALMLDIAAASTNILDTIAPPPASDSKLNSAQPRAMNNT